MTTIIVGTNRANSKSTEIGKITYDLAKQYNDNIELLDLSAIKDFGVSAQMYDPSMQSKEIAEIQDRIIKPSKKWIVIIPEYNGGVPGIFKLFIDTISIRDKDQNFDGKDVFLIGVAAGRAGNARGIDYLTNCLNYLGMNVFLRNYQFLQLEKYWVKRD